MKEVKRNVNHKAEKTVTKELRDRYKRSSKKENTLILKEFSKLTRYN
ncbi:unnamed protein product [marine sediment metagenome]|uniref:Uncharacterized protein n=1 Tax=marine sediment metagenome TaxID=412755 RepID=X1HY60_9ZZZZ